jgi:hypothetical protein
MTISEIKTCKQRGLSAEQLLTQLAAQHEHNRRQDVAAVARVYGATAFELIWKHTEVQS